LTDPLTGKQLVEKSYEYIDRLTKESARALLQEFNASHRKFDPAKLGAEIGNEVVQWFARRDKNVRLTLDPASIQQQPNVVRLKFNGSTKDAQFTFGATATTFSVPSGSGPPMSFVKTLVFAVDKTNFAKPR
jgi:hypothetical protein